MIDKENLEDFILSIEYVNMIQGIDVLIEGKKYKLSRGYLEDYSDGTYKIV